MRDVPIKECELRPGDQIILWPARVAFAIWVVVVDEIDEVVA